MQCREAEAKWHVHQKSYICDFGEVRSVPKPNNNCPLRQAWTHERIPNEDVSRWLIASHDIQVSMPGILEPYPNQSDERVCRGQFKEGDDPELTKTFNIGTIEATGLLNCIVRDMA